jgi:hypothetical protein
MRPLPNKTRVTSLVLLIILFVLITPILIAYSLGYRVLDIDSVFTLEKTGGIYVHSNISDTTVYLDGEFNKTNGTFFRNTLIQNLKPETNHLVEVKKDGYQTWTKKLPVYSSLVTESRVLMIPTSVPQREVFPFVDKNGDGTTTPSIKAKIVKGKPVPTDEEYKNLMTLFEGKDIYATSTQTKIITSLNTGAVATTSTSTKDLPEYFVKLGIKDPKSLKNLIQNAQEISWLDNGNVVLNWVGDTSEIPYYYCVAPENCDEKIVLDWKDEIKKFDFLPGRNDVFLALVNSGLYAVEADGRSERNVQAVYTNKIDDFLIGPNNKIFVRDGDRFFELTI